MFMLNICVTLLVHACFKYIYVLLIVIKRTLFIQDDIKKKYSNFIGT